LVRVLVDRHQKLSNPGQNALMACRSKTGGQPPVGLAADAGVASPITAVVETAREVATFLILGSPGARTAWAYS
jgi:hypothetical protein